MYVYMQYGARALVTVYIYVGYGACTVHGVWCPYCTWGVVHVLYIGCGACTVHGVCMVHVLYMGCGTCTVHAQYAGNKANTQSTL